MSEHSSFIYEYGSPRKTALQALGGSVSHGLHPPLEAVDQEHSVPVVITKAQSPPEARCNFCLHFIGQNKGHIQTQAPR